MEAAYHGMENSVSLHYGFLPNIVIMNCIVRDNQLMNELCEIE